MTFSRIWNNANPPGTRAAAEIDDAIRELRVDMDERLAAKIFSNTPGMGTPASTNPDDLVVKPEILGKVDDKILMIHGTQFQVENDENVDYSGSGTIFASEAAPSRCPLCLPPGVFIVRMRWLVSNNLAHTLTMSLKSLAFDVGLAQTTHSDYTLTHALATTAIKDTGALAVVDQVEITETDSFFIEADVPGSSSINTSTIHAVEITYRVPDCRNTI